MKDRQGECLGKISHPYRVWKAYKHKFSENTELVIGRSLNHFPTNLYADQLKYCLDLVATNIPLTHTLVLFKPLGKSDHQSILGSIYTSPIGDAASRRQVWCWSKANQQALKAAVASANWTDVPGA